MLNNPIYCSFGFLKDFLSHECRQLSLIPRGDEIEKHANWSNFQGFLLHNRICLKESKKNISDSIRQNSTSILEKEVASSILDALGPIYKLETEDVYKTPQQAQSGSIHLNNVFTVEENTFSELSGVLILTPDDVVKRTELYVDSGIALSLNESVSWDDIVDACLPRKRYNSLIIIDNFAPKGGERNLGELLRTLLPEQLSVGSRFYLTIFCNGRNPDRSFVYLDHNAELSLTEFNIRNHYLNEISYKDRIDISLIYSDYHRKSPFHDRVIITDYNFVIAPGGLDLLYEDGTSSKLTVIYGFYPDFIQQSQSHDKDGQAKISYLYKNLDVIVNTFGHTKAMNNPIIKQYSNIKIKADE